MAKNKIAKNNKIPFNVLRKGTVCALIGATAIAGGLLVGCDSSQDPAAVRGTQIYYGVENPNDAEKEAVLGDYYIETDVGDLWNLTDQGWEVVANITGPQGKPGKTPTIDISEDGYWVINNVKSNLKAVVDEDAKGDPGEQGDPGVGLTDVTVQPHMDKDGNMYMEYTFHYTNGTTTTDRAYTGNVIYVGTEMTFETAVKEIIDGGTIVLNADAKIEETAVINKHVTIDLNGRYIQNDSSNPIWDESTKSWSLLSVREGGDLTIEDSMRIVDGSEQDGGLTAAAEDCYAIDVQEGGKCTINGGIYQGNVSAVYVHTGELVVNDGIFYINQLASNDDAGWRFTLNCYNKNYKNGTAKITVNGGQFVNFDPAQAGDDGNYVSAGNTSVSAKIEEGLYVYMVCPVAEAVEMLPTMAGNTVSITLTEDLMLPTLGMVIGDGVDLTVNLNGHTISAPNDVVGNGVFHVTTGGKLTIKGQGTIDAECKSEYKMAIWADGGEVIIEDGTFTNSTTDGTDNQYDLIYASNSGTVTINGGIFDCKTPRWTLNVKNADKDKSSIVVKGGTFKNYNPSASTTDENDGNVPPTNFVATGYIVESSTESTDTWYSVVEAK